MQRLGELDGSLDLRVFRNDQVTIDQLESLDPTHLIVSPGPCTPNEAGISVECISYFSGCLPILGVCLGHQSIGQAFGATIVRARRLMHGKTDQIQHDGRGIFSGLPNPMTATRYHSLVIDPPTLPDMFEVSAWSQTPAGELEIMGIRHQTLPVVGVQFHPESFLCTDGHQLLQNFLEMQSVAS